MLLLSRPSSGRLLAALALAATAAVAGVAAQGQVPVSGRNVNINGGPASVTFDAGSQLQFQGDFNNKMQNEGVCAANPLKPSDLICAYNNYSQVLELPGADPGKITRDATLGVSQSRDMGGHWVSEFLVGASYLDSRRLPDGSASPLTPFQFHAAADAGVVATPGGLAHVSGIFFKGTHPDTGLPAGAIAVTTLIDPLNDDSSATPFRYVWQRIVMLGTDQDGGEFIDKPWMTRGETKIGTCAIPVKPGVTKTVDAYGLYLTWAVFTGTTPGDDSANIYVSRSIDCGASWSAPTRITTTGIHQAPVISVQPRTNNVDLAWRRFASPGQTDAIVWTRSTNGGANFRTPNEIAEICPFSQGTSQATFRINTFPTMAAGPEGVYVAWSDRRDEATGQCTGDALIRWSFYNTGSWGAPTAIDDPMTQSGADGTLAHLPGHHQIQPALAYSNGTLGASWYDFRNDQATTLTGEPGGQSDRISEAGLATRHTVDVRGAFATLDPQSGEPTWGPSAEISRYARGVRGAGSEVQLQFNRPNMRLFRLSPTTPAAQRGVPFFSDYIHLAPLEQTGGQTGQGAATPYFFASWTDTRDAVNTKLPTYVAPLSAACTTQPREQTKTLDMNLYGAVVTKGAILAYSPSGSRPLGATPRTFVVVVRNTSNETRSVRLVARQPAGGTAVFVPERTVELGGGEPIVIPRLSGISRTVQVSQNEDQTLAANAAVVVDIYEPASAASPTHTVFMNADPYPIALEIPEGGVDPNTAEVHTPLIDDDIRVSQILVPAPEIESPEIESPEIESPEIESPEIESNALSPEIESPEIESPEIESPEIESPEIESAGIRDVSFVVQNTGNDWTSYRTRALVDGIDPQLYQIQLLIWSQYNVQNVGCGAVQAATNQVAVNITDADVTSDSVSPSSVQNATVAVGPGETYVVTLRFRAIGDVAVPDAIVNNIGLVVTSEADNTGAGGVRPTLILPPSLPFVAEATSAAGAAVSFTVGTNAGSTVTCSPQSGSQFPLGATRVSCTATNGQNNTVTGTFTLIVADTAGPSIAAHADVTAEAASVAGAVVTYTAPQALDAVDGVLGPASCLPASGSLFAMGDTLVTCTATDGHGNAAESTTFVVHVADTVGPTIAPQANVGPVQATGAGGAVAFYASPSTSDLVSGAGVATCAPASGSLFPLGSTTVTCQAEDAAGNQAPPTTFLVIVADTTPPVASCPAPTSVLAGAAATVPVPNVLPGVIASDVVTSTLTLTQSPAAGTPAGIGTTPIVVTVRDAAGNLTTCGTALTVVRDVVPPTLTVTVNPSKIWQPNGSLVRVTVSGVVTDSGSGPASTVSYTVTDEYSKLPTKIIANGTAAVGPTGSYSFFVNLQATRQGKDKNGRQYTFTITARDNAGNVSTAVTVVTAVEHDQGS